MGLFLLKASSNLMLQVFVETEKYRLGYIYVGNETYCIIKPIMYGKPRMPKTHDGKFHVSSLHRMLVDVCCLDMNLII